MSNKWGGYILSCIVAIIGLSLFFGYAVPFNGNAAPLTNQSRAEIQEDYIVLAWNDLGMHCMNSDFSDLAVLPPYNTLWVQVIHRGEIPEIVTEGITVWYEFTENTYSVGKTNFWSYEEALFGVNLPDNIGLTGMGLSGFMDLQGDHFIAEGIPLTEFTDDSDTPQPLQLATIKVYGQGGSHLLAETITVSPVSSEMRCDVCHADGENANEDHNIATGKTDTNILTLHDLENSDDYPAGAPLLMNSRPVLCARCHASNALGTTGEPGIPNLSNAMHAKHADEEEDSVYGCYDCHPGPRTQCLRDVMSQEEGMTCTDCHGSLAQVAQNPNPWLNEPRCDNQACHGSSLQQNHDLYRFSTGHGFIYCSACHDSTHAIAPSREPEDGIKFVDLQGEPGTLSECSVCHTIEMADNLFSHDSWITTFLPYIGK